MTRTRISNLLDAFPVVLAPMEDVTDAAFRRIARTLGASVCMTEFVGSEQLIASSKLAQQRARLETEDRPTGIQIYGANPDLLVAAARIAEAAEPSFIDINCGCWVPAIARRGAGAGWLRDPVAMVEMVRRITAAVSLPVTVKTRIGWGPESHMPIVDLARHLEDARIEALTIHCRTAAMGHRGPADWTWAARAQSVVTIPVIVNGDIRSADDAVRALAETGCAAVMIGRAAIDHPWIFRETRAQLAGVPVERPTDAERRAVYRALLEANIASRGQRGGVHSTKRHVGVLDPSPSLRQRVVQARDLAEAYAAIH